MHPSCDVDFDRVGAFEVSLVLGAFKVDLVLNTVRTMSKIPEHRFGACSSIAE